MDGRVSLGDQVVALPALRQGKAQKRGELWHLLLNDKSRGKVVIGDVKVLFQFVTPPPVQPRPQLPPSVRASLMQNMDWMLVAVVAASFLLHFGFVIYLRNIDWPRQPDVEEIPDRFVQMLVPKKIEEPKPVVAQTDDSKKDDKKDAAKKDKGESKPKAAPKVRDPEAEARAAAERRARLAADVQKMGVLKILGARGDNGAVADSRQGRRRLGRRRQGVRAGRRRRRGGRGSGRRLALGAGRRRLGLVARRRIAARVGSRRSRHRRKGRREGGPRHHQGLGAAGRGRLARSVGHRARDPQPTGRHQGLLRSRPQAQSRTSVASCSCASRSPPSAR